MKLDFQFVPIVLAFVHRNVVQVLIFLEILLEKHGKESNLPYQLSHIHLCYAYYYAFVQYEVMSNLIGTTEYIILDQSVANFPCMSMKT